MDMEKFVILTDRHKHNITYINSYSAPCAHKVCKLNNCHQPHAYSHWQPKSNRTEPNQQRDLFYALAHGNSASIKSQQCTQKLIRSSEFHFISFCLYVCLCVSVCVASKLYTCNIQILSKHLLM